MLAMAEPEDVEAEAAEPESEAMEEPEERAESEAKEDIIIKMKIQVGRANPEAPVLPEETAVRFMFWMESPCMHMGEMAGQELFQMET